MFGERSCRALVRASPGNSEMLEGGDTSIIVINKEITLFSQSKRERHFGYGCKKTFNIDMMSTFRVKDDMGL